MENKKKLEVNCATCDIRNLTEEILSQYEKVEINAAALIMNQAVQALLGKYTVEINAAASFCVEDSVRFSTCNGPMTLSASQAVPQEKSVVLVNGPLTLEPGCEEVLKSYVGMTVNGPVTCPESMTGLLSGFTINGPVRPYPDGSIVLKKSTVLDRFFHLRAKQDALYYAARRIIALAPDVNFGKLAEKNVRFATKTLIVSESHAEAAVPLFDDKTDIIVLPDGCAYVDDDAELNGTLLKRYGGKLFIGGRMTIGADSAPLLDQVSYLKVDGDLLVCKSLKDRVMTMDIAYDGLRVVGGVLITDRAYAEVSAAMLEAAEDGVSVMDCATVLIAEDVTPELLREKLVSIGDCATIQCTPVQRPVIEELARDVAHIESGSGEEEAGENGEEPKNEDVVEINAATYTF
ncbi:MAG: hypothetical protein K2N78_01560 [Oscillospiraceae bacterium]|nr:hypothetical protein [Oscillospiraceae bacterium]